MPLFIARFALCNTWLTVENRRLKKSCSVGFSGIGGSGLVTPPRPTNTSPTPEHYVKRISWVSFKLTHYHSQSSHFASSSRRSVTTQAYAVSLRLSEANGEAHDNCTRAVTHRGNFGMCRYFDIERHSWVERKQGYGVPI